MDSWPRPTRRVRAKGCAGSRSVAWIVAAGVLLAGPSLSLPGQAAAAATRPQLLFGAYSPRDPDTGRSDTAGELERQTGRRLDIVHWYQPWGSGDSIVGVQRDLLAALTAAGRIPLITWEPWDPRNDTPTQPYYGLAWIAAGTYDALISRWAEQLRDVGRPIYLRPMHEMNGDWYPWAGSVNDNSPEHYIAAWRHIVDVFRSHGAANVRFVWSPNHRDAAGNTMERFYPGSGYVDVLATDGYNWGAEMPRNGGWRSFGEIFQNAYDRLTKLGPQPIWITEVASAPEGGNKAAWIRDMFAKARRMRRLGAIVWFNENKERDWRAAATPRTAAAFRPRARLRLRAARTVRVGRAASLGWTATDAVRVTSWKVALNGHTVRTVATVATRGLRVHVARSGHNHWRVTGYDARSRRIVSAARGFVARGRGR